METFAKRLQASIKHAGISASELALDLKVSYQAVKKALDGKSASFSAENVFRAAHIMNVNPHWLATGEGDMVAGDVDRHAAAPKDEPDIEQVLRVLIKHLDSLSDAERESVASSLQTLARAPDSAKAKAAALASLGSTTQRQNNSMSAKEMPDFLKNEN